MRCQSSLADLDSRRDFDPKKKLLPDVPTAEIHYYSGEKRVVGKANLTTGSGTEKKTGPSRPLHSLKMGSAACDGEPSVLAWTNKAVNLVNLGLPLAGPVPSQNLPARCSQAFRLTAGWLSCPERTGPLSRSLRSGFPKGPRRLPRQEGKWCPYQQVPKVLTR